MSKIEWTHRPGTKSEVLNPTTGCDKISRGCRNCYAEVMHKRLTGMGQPKYQEPFLGHVRFWPDELSKPFGWKKPRTVFLNSMSDIFHKDVLITEIAEIYAMMFLNPTHTFIVLTKRADRAKIILNSYEFIIEYANACNRLHDKYIQTLSDLMYGDDELKSMWPLKNVWQGVSVESQEQYDRIEHLSLTPAYIRVLSYEPAVGPLDLRDSFGLYEYDEGKFGLKVGGGRWLGSPDWVIAGGESGPKASPPHPDWFRLVRDQCKAAGVAFFFKQWGSNALGSHIDLDRNFVMLKNGEHGLHIPLTKGYSVEEWDKQSPIMMHRCSKKESGNFLDGRQHLEFPA